MNTPLSRALPLVALLLSLLACKMLGGGKSYENNSAGLTQLAQDLSAADKGDAEKMGEALALPDPAAFFTATFGPELGPTLAADYATDKAKLKGVQAFFILNKLKGRTEVLVEQHTNADDENMNALQEAAVRAMKTPTVIYTINVVEPGKTIGASLWSFAFVDGTVRDLGKLKAAKPNASPLDELSKKDLADALKGN
jgi:hypothetical protein